MGEAGRAVDFDVACAVGLRPVTITAVTVTETGEQTYTLRCPTCRQDVVGVRGGPPSRCATCGRYASMLYALEWLCQQQWPAAEFRMPVRDLGEHGYDSVLSWTDGPSEVQVLTLIAQQVPEALGDLNTFFTLERAVNVAAFVATVVRAHQAGKRGAHLAISVESWVQTTPLPVPDQPVYVSESLLDCDDPAEAAQLAVAQQRAEKAAQVAATVERVLPQLPAHLTGRPVAYWARTQILDELPAVLSSPA